MPSRARTRTFYRVTAPRTITVIPDTPAKRREYEEEIVRTFYLSNADLKEAMDLLRIVIDVRRIAPITGDQRDLHQGHARAHRRRRRADLGAIDKARPEVVIDVELLEVDRTRLLEYGLQIASPGNSPGINGIGWSQQRADVTLQRLPEPDAGRRVLDRRAGALLSPAEDRQPTRATLANPQLRTSEGMPAQARFGERVPVPVTTFAPIATGGSPQQPITSFNYENIGVNIDITPRTHHNDDVTLDSQSARDRAFRGRASATCRRSVIERSTRRSACETAKRTCSRASFATTNE